MTTQASPPRNGADDREFSPQPITLQGKSYLEVAQRVLWLRTEHPDAQIVTEVVEHDRTEGYALVRATATIPSTGGLATGYGSAARKDLRGPVALAYIEKAETRAIGRACAGLGYGTLAALTEDGETLADAPVAAPTEQAQPFRAVRHQPHQPGAVSDAAPGPAVSPARSEHAPAAVNGGPPRPAYALTPDEIERIKVAQAGTGYSDAERQTWLLREYAVLSFALLAPERREHAIRALEAEAAAVQGRAPVEVGA